MSVDIGTVVNGFTVEAVAFDRPGNWFVTCPSGHTEIFATTSMLEAGMSCQKCASESTNATKLQALNHARAIEAWRTEEKRIV